MNEMSLENKVVSIEIKIDEIPSDKLSISNLKDLIDYYRVYDDLEKNK